MSQEPLIKFRPYQRRARAMKSGIAGIIARRQSGKSYWLGTRGLELMMIPVNGKPADVLFMSAALRLGMENIRKEAMIWRDVTDKMRQMVHAKGAFTIKTSADDDNGRLLDVDAIADLFESQKLETRIHHDNGNGYARSVVMAPNPDTAVGWTGHTFMDEVGRMPEFRDCFEAAEPFVSSNPDYILRMVTTPPPDDTHASYEMLSPRTDADFPVSEKGNFYRSEKGILILRVDAWDAAAAGVPLYDSETRKPVTPEQHRARAVDKVAWDRNYGCKFIKGGSAAISKTDLDHACAQGAGQCLGIKITEQLALAS